MSKFQTVQYKFGLTPLPQYNHNEEELNIKKLKIFWRFNVSELN